ncbi:MAG: MgtC/SapB family protein [Armatimonadota bacterium]
MAPMELAELFKIFAVSLLLGAFIGLERERGRDRPLGIRSFALLTGAATLAALIAERTGCVWIVPTAFVGLAALLVVGHLGMTERGRYGLTTELAAVMAFGLGVLVFTGPMELAVALGVVTAAVLHFKPQLHALADKATGKDIVAMVQFGLVAFVVLPVLPNRAFGPYQVINPYNVWLMVVLVSGINLAGYVSLKLVGAKYGGLSAGVLGGLVSSTATTYSFSRRACENGALSGAAALAIIVATAVTVPRMAVEIAIVNPGFLRQAALPMALVFLASLAPCLVFWWRAGGGAQTRPPEVRNPVQLWGAILFGLIYALVILALAAGQSYFGSEGTYLVGALSGLTDVNAITLSTARLVGTERLAAASGADVVVIAYLANLLAKGILAAFVGTRELARIVALAFGFAFVAGVIVVVAL